MRPEELPERVAGDPRPAEGGRAEIDRLRAAAGARRGRRRWSPAPGTSSASRCRRPRRRRRRRRRRPAQARRSTSAAGSAATGPRSWRWPAVAKGRPVVVVATNDGGPRLGRQGRRPGPGRGPGPRRRRRRQGRRRPGRRHRPDRRSPRRWRGRAHGRRARHRSMVAEPMRTGGVRLGVDVGQVRVGLAASDPSGLLATPVADPAAGPRRALGPARPIAAPVREREASRSWSGLPRSPVRARAEAAALARDYAVRARRGWSPRCPVRLVDERLTTVESHRTTARQWSGRPYTAQCGRPGGRGAHPPVRAGRRARHGTCARHEGRPPAAPATPTEGPSMTDRRDPASGAGTDVGLGHVGDPMSATTRSTASSTRTTSTAASGHDEHDEHLGHGHDPFGRPGGRVAARAATRGPASPPEAPPGRPDRRSGCWSSVVAIALIGGAGFAAVAVLKPVFAGFGGDTDYRPDGRRHRGRYAPRRHGPGHRQNPLRCGRGQDGQGVHRRGRRQPGQRGHPARRVHAEEGDERRRGADILLDPANRTVPMVTIPEGRWKSEVLAILAKASGKPVADYEAARRTPRPWACRPRPRATSRGTSSRPPTSSPRTPRRPSRCGRWSRRRSRR